MAAGCHSETQKMEQLGGGRPIFQRVEQVELNSALNLTPFSSMVRGIYFEAYSLGAMTERVLGNILR